MQRMAWGAILRDLAPMNVALRTSRFRIIPMHLSTVQMLSCPVCRGELELEAAGVRCPVGHSFDIARQGYVNLVTNMHSVRIR